jgi:hypothetical protein
MRARGPISKRLSLLTLIVDTMLINHSIRILENNVTTTKNLREHGKMLREWIFIKALSPG